MDVQLVLRATNPKEEQAIVRILQLLALTKGEFVDLSQLANLGDWKALAALPELFEKVEELQTLKTGLEVEVKALEQRKTELTQQQA